MAKRKMKQKRKKRRRTTATGGSADKRQTIRIRYRERHLARVSKRSLGLIQDLPLYSFLITRSDLPAVTIGEAIQRCQNEFEHFAKYIEALPKTDHFLSGLADLICETLKLYELSVRVSRTERTNSKTRHMLAIVQDEDAELKWLRTQICQPFFRKVLIVTRDPKHLRTIWPRIQQVLRKELRHAEFTSNSGGWQGMGTEIRITTLAGLKGQHVFRANLAIFLGKCGGTRAAIQSLLHSNISYACVLRQQDIPSLTRNEALDLVMMYGDATWINRPVGRVPDGDIQLAWLPRPTYPAGEFTSSTERDRALIWRNASRNELIAKAAQSIQNRDHAVTSELGLTSVSQSIRSQEHISPIILVENVEHAQQLGQLLPDWEIEAMDTPMGDKSELLPNGIHGIPNRIMTLRRAMQLYLTHDLIIYAAGQGSAWVNQVLGGTIYAVTILDIPDDVDELTRYTEKRKLGYLLSYVTVT